MVVQKVSYLQKKPTEDNLNVCILNLFSKKKHPAKFSGHKSCKSRDMIFSIFHFKGGSLSELVNTLPSFVLRGLLQVDI